MITGMNVIGFVMSIISGILIGLPIWWLLTSRTPFSRYFMKPSKKEIFVMILVGILLFISSVYFMGAR